MNTTVFHYFNLRNEGVRPAQAWAFACERAEHDEVNANLAASREALISFLERVL